MRRSLIYLFPKLGSLQTSLVKGLLVLLILAVFSGCASTGSSGGGDAVKNADKALIHAQLARGYLQQKQYAVAKDELERALRINPRHSDSNYVMALLMMELEQYPEAEKHFAEAVRYDSENASAAHDFGMFLCQIGKEQKAVKYFQIAAENPLFEKAELSYMRAGECLARIDDPSAEQYLKRALAEDPKLRPALHRLAMIKYEAGSYLSARAFIERYFAITEPQPGPLLLAYRIESKLNSEAAANDYRTTLLEDFPGSEQANILREQLRQ